MTRIHFVVNPIAGKGTQRIDEQILRQHFDSAHELCIKTTERKHHAKSLAQDSVNEGAEIIVACGGDGTINEVAAALVDTNIPLGIIPTGSGNGLASNLKIPKTINQAIALIKQGHSTKIDVGTVNGNYFFSNTGFGFDASVIKHYEASDARTISAYFRASIKSFTEYGKQEVQIEMDEAKRLLNPFLIFISNSNELGYNVSLTPQASLQDGLLDVVIVPQISRFRMLLFGLYMLSRKPEKMKGVRCFQSKKLTLNRLDEGGFQAQIDGEHFVFDNETVEIAIKEKALRILVQ